MPLLSKLAFRQFIYDAVLAACININIGQGIAFLNSKTQSVHDPAGGVEYDREDFAADGPVEFDEPAHLIKIRTLRAFHSDLRMFLQRPGARDDKVWWAECGSNLLFTHPVLGSRESGVAEQPPPALP